MNRFIRFVIPLTLALVSLTVALVPDGYWVREGRHYTTPDSAKFAITSTFYVADSLVARSIAPADTALDTTVIGTKVTYDTHDFTWNGGDSLTITVFKLAYGVLVGFHDRVLDENYVVKTRASGNGSNSYSGTHTIARPVVGDSLVHQIISTATVDSMKQFLHKRSWH